MKKKRGQSRSEVTVVPPPLLSSVFPYHLREGEREEEGLNRWRRNRRDNEHEARRRNEDNRRNSLDDTREATSLPLKPRGQAFFILFFNMSHRRVLVQRRVVSASSFSFLLLPSIRLRYRCLFILLLVLHPNL